MMIIGTDSW